MSQAGDEHFLDHPRVQAVFGAAVELMNESDRGAVLVGLSFVDEELAHLFRTIAPPEFGKKQLARLLKYPGALDGVAAKTSVAVICSVLSPQLGSAIDALRSIRNKVAHSTAAFRLRDHWELVKRAYDVGPDMPIAINRLALEAIIDDTVQDMLALKHPADPDRPVFNTPREVLDYLTDHKNLLKPLNDRLPRLELAIAIGMICGLIIINGNNWLEKMGVTDRRL